MSFDKGKIRTHKRIRVIAIAAGIAITLFFGSGHLLFSQSIKEKYDKRSWKQVSPIAVEIAFPATDLGGTEPIGRVVRHGTTLKVHLIDLSGGGASGEMFPNPPRTRYVTVYGATNINKVEYYRPRSSVPTQIPKSD